MPPWMPKYATSSRDYEAIEERARNELGMIRQDEIFFHIVNEKND